MNYRYTGRTLLWSDDLKWNVAYCTDARGTEFIGRNFFKGLAPKDLTQSAKGAKAQRRTGEYGNREATDGEDLQITFGLAGGGWAMEKVSLVEKFAAFSDHWRPKVVGELNGQEVKLVKFQGAFVWHRHEAEDELFLVWRGRFRVEFRDRVVELGPGEFLIVPRGVEHRTVADEEAEVVVFEPAATRNTGDVVDTRFTAPQGVRI